MALCGSLWLPGTVMDHLGGGLVASVGVDMKAGKHYTLFVATNKDGQGVAVVLADDIEWPRVNADRACRLVVGLWLTRRVVHAFRHTLTWPSFVW